MKFFLPSSSVCCLIFRSHFTLALIKNKFKNLTAMILLWKVMRWGENARLPLIFSSPPSLCNQTSLEVLVIAVQRILARQSFSNLLEGKCLVLIYNNIMWFWKRQHDCGFCLGWEKIDAAFFFFFFKWRNVRLLDAVWVRSSRESILINAFCRLACGLILTAGTNLPLLFC